MYIKQVRFGKVSGQGAIPTDHIAPMYVPESGYTKAEITAEWNRRGTLADALQGMQLVAACGGGFPCYNPGYLTGSPPLESRTNYDTCLQFAPYSAKLTGTLNTPIDRVKYSNDAGTGFYIMRGSGIWFVNSSGSSVQQFGNSMSQLGVYAETSDSVKAGAIVKSSDNYIGVFNFYFNRNNSRLDWFNYNTSQQIIAWLEGLEDVQTDPYVDGDGESTEGGGGGDLDGTGDDIGIPSLPTLSAADTGFITLFNPSTGELKSLANYMWSTGFDIDTFKKLFADPMSAILGLSIVPVAVPNGGSRAVTVGNISTNVYMNLAASQYVEIDCGSINVNEYWGAYLDYDPYTKAEIYLPYVGTHPLSIDDIMGKSVRVVYHVDILSGSCIAFVQCANSVLYSFAGQCSCSIPITGNDWTNVINGALSIAASIGTMVATGGASAPLSVAAVASTAVNSMKPTVEKSGALGGMGGMLGVQTPYIILTRPKQAVPKNQNKYTGYPSFLTRELGSLSGYTEIESIHLEGVNATDDELTEIVSLLKSGVIL